MVINRIKSLKQKETRMLFFKDASLMLAMFFLPLGYDAIFRFMMNITGSYWGADIVFYGISSFFWLSYILLTRRSNKKKPLN
jgi:hypothetical protein